MQKKENNKYLVIGLGKTGVSCIDYLLCKGNTVSAADTRTDPLNLKNFKEKYPDIDIVLGIVPDKQIKEADIIVVSPGISFKEQFIKKAVEWGKRIVGDVELFVREAKAPIIAVTGTNGKTTVTTLIGKVGEKSGLNVLVGGNIGTPVLELLKKPVPDLYVLELSSFQLQTTHSMCFDVAVLLNITEDHIDHHGSMESYRDAKLKIFKNCKNAVLNIHQEVHADGVLKIKNRSNLRHGFGRQAAVTLSSLNVDNKGVNYNLTEYINLNDKLNEENVFSFALNKPNFENDFGIIESKGKKFLAGYDELIMPVSDLKIVGTHNQENALAVLAAGKAFGFDNKNMISVLKEFKGIKHRCQLVTVRNGVKWYNDSKATNVGATIAAVKGLGSENKNIILIAGGIGKDADFNELRKPLEKYVKQLILFGRDVQIIHKAVKGSTYITFAENLADAVCKADNLSKKGELVLFAPACASFDMFKNYEHRGDEFIKQIKAISV